MKPETAVLHVADIHIGKRTKSFNVAIAKERVKLVGQRVAHVIKRDFAGRELDKLVVLDSGDGCEGEAIYKTQLHHLDPDAMTGMRQSALYAEIMGDMLLQMQEDTGLPVEFHGVPGNHGRVNSFTDEANNWDVLAYQMLQMRREVKVDYSSEFYKVIGIQGWGHLLYHGKGIKSYGGIPWYGISQRAMRWQGSIPDGWEYLHVGHFHSYGHTWWPGFEMMLSGTCVTDDDFSLEMVGSDGVNRWRLFGVHPEHGVTWQYPIRTA